MKNSASRTTKSKSVVSDALMMLPLGVVLGIMPLIVRYAEFETKLDQYGWFAFGETSVDFFLKDKAVILVFSAVLMLVLAAYKWFMDDLKWKNSVMFIPLGIYIGMTIISTILSDYPYFGIHGITDQFESVWVLASYVICAYYAFLFVDSLAQLRILSVYFISGTCILNAIGLTQALNIDFFQTKFGKKLITPTSFWNSLDTLQFYFPKGYVYTTLYNPNYVGVYLALIIPVLCAMFFCYKGVKKKIGMAALILVTMINLFFSRSQGGEIALAGAVALTAVLIWPKFSKKGKVVWGCCLLAGATACGLLAFLPASPVHQKLSAYFAKQEKPHLTTLSCDKKGVHFTYDEESYTITYSEDEMGEIKIQWMDADGNQLQTSEITLEDGNTGYTVPEKSFANTLYATVIDLSSIQSGMNGIALHGGGTLTFYFTNEADETGTYRYINSSGRFDDIVDSPSAVFTEHGSLFTDRGFLWSKTIPLLKDYLVIGSGADTFTLIFPNNDYLAKANNNYSNMLVTKPHSIYLQIWVQSGLLALLGFLVFQCWYIFSSLKMWFRNDWKRPEILLSFGIAIGVIAYMIGGIANDSCVAVAPVYWCLIGIGCAVNHMLHKEKN
ncbi:MAG: O-antigen ligase family protein [Clostridiales bacterium]|nr:O-antigen ligase family protein [Clostridiales bacterium]